MAEIFTLVVTCVGLVKEIGKAISTIDDLIEAYRDVPDDLENLASWLKTTRRTIKILQASLDTPGKVHDSVKDDFNRSLQSCLKTVTKLHGTLEEIAVDAAKGGEDVPVVTVDIATRFKYLWDKSSITVEKTELHEHMQAIDVLLHVIQFSQGHQQRVEFDKPENAAALQTPEAEGTYTHHNTIPQPLTDSPHGRVNRRSFHFRLFGKKTSLGKELCKAASEGDVDQIRSLVAKGAKVDFKSGDSAPYSTPSSLALQQRKLASLLALSEYGAAVNIRTCGETQCCTPLSLAAEIGTADDIKKLIQYGADPDFVITKEEKNSPLHIAAMLGRFEAVEALIEGRASLGLQGWQGQTPLHMASSEEVSRALVRNGASLHILDDNKELPIHSAARRGFRDAISDMLTQHAPLNNPNKLGSTPLSVACRNGHTDLVKYLIERGGRLLLNDGGLGEACQAGALPETIEAYIIAGAPINALYLGYSIQDPFRGVSPLHIACIFGRIDIAGLLLRWSADINMRDSRDGRTALHWAANRYGDGGDIIKLLIDNGADVNSRDEAFNSPLHVAAFCAKDASSDLPDPKIAQLLTAHPNINNRNSKGQTPLHVLCQNTSAVSTLHALLEAGADYMLADDNLVTPGEVLVTARSKDAAAGYANMARLLVQAGARGFDRREERMKRLHDMILARDLPAVNALLDTGVRVSNDAFCAAVEHATPEIVRSLIKGGADVNGSSQYGASDNQIFPLHLACRVRSEPLALELCKILLDAGAWPSMPMEGSGKTPRYFAELRDHSRVRDLLRAREATEAGGG